MSPFAQAARATLVFTLVFTSPLLAQDRKFPPIVDAPRPALPAEIPLYPGTAPGSSASALPEQWDTLSGEAMVRNVTVPTIIPILPDPAKATGAAVIVAPGGAYVALSMDSEGLNVARKLADNGIAAFILKYRLDLTPRDIPGFTQAIAARFAGATAPDHRGIKPIVDPLAIDDAATALKLVRARAAEFHIDAARTGMLGFSAGAMTTLTLTLQDRAEAMPSFIGIIYGPMLAVTVPPHAPPLFAALASDDPLFGNQGFGLITSWQQAKRPVELHYYEHGDHGFGMHHQGTTSDLWFDEFVSWMRDRKLLSPAN